MAKFVKGMSGNPHGRPRKLVPEGEPAPAAAAKPAAPAKPKRSKPKQAPEPPKQFPPEHTPAVQAPVAASDSKQRSGGILRSLLFGQ